MMTDFKSREDYERWKAERSGGNPPTTGQQSPAPASPAGQGPPVPRISVPPSPSAPSRPRNRRALMFLGGVLAVIVGIFVVSTRAPRGPQTSGRRTKAHPAKANQEWPEVIQDAQKAVVLLKAGESVGSGFFFSESGDILTNNHVIQDNETVQVQLHNGRTMKGKVTMRGQGPLDLAIVHVLLPPSGTDDVPALHLADLKECMQGQEVVSIGSPLGMESSAAKGIVSNCDRSIPVGPTAVRFIQTDTPSNPGNSGGPLINRSGEVVGIMTLKATGFNVEGMNFAISSSTLGEFTAGRFNAPEVRKALDKKVADAKQTSAEDEEMAVQTLEFMLEQVKEVWEEERRAFQDRVLKARETKKITPLETMALLKLADEPPDGYLTLDLWLREITVIVTGGELTTEAAREMIKKRFPI